MTKLLQLLQILQILQIRALPGSLTIQTALRRPPTDAGPPRGRELSADSQRSVTFMPPAAGTNGVMTPGRQCLDTAQGVLIALRHCTVDETFREIIRAAQQHQVPLFSLADALVTAATGDAECPNAAARTAALAEWGPLLRMPERFAFG